MLFDGTACFSPSVHPSLRSAWVKHGGLLTHTKTDFLRANFFFCAGPDDPWLKECVQPNLQIQSLAWFNYLHRWLGCSPCLSVRHAQWIAKSVAERFLVPVSKYLLGDLFDPRKLEPARVEGRVIAIPMPRVIPEPPARRQQHEEPQSRPANALKRALNSSVHDHSQSDVGPRPLKRARIQIQSATPHPSSLNPAITNTSPDPLNLLGPLPRVPKPKPAANPKPNNNNISRPSPARPNAHLALIPIPIPNPPPNAIPDGPSHAVANANPDPPPVPPAPLKRIDFTALRRPSVPCAVPTVTLLSFACPRPAACADLSACPTLTASAFATTKTSRPHVLADRTNSIGSISNSNGNTSLEPPTPAQHATATTSTSTSHPTPQTRTRTHTTLATLLLDAPPVQACVFDLAHTFQGKHFSALKNDRALRYSNLRF
ncbi:hypothetical protein C8J57DRAFT_1500169 [Mycena rebaudengoi]|nr:hypothetical protein C8J57DRAFT_1500169 [Mycena rebaudengoi]